MATIKLNFKKCWERQ